MKEGYARVSPDRISTQDQKLDLQLDTLKNRAVKKYTGKDQQCR